MCICIETYQGPLRPVWGVTRWYLYLQLKVHPKWVKGLAQNVIQKIAFLNLNLLFDFEIFWLQEQGEETGLFCPAHTERTKFVSPA